jgi:hypothetical protein
VALLHQYQMPTDDPSALGRFYDGLWVPFREEL